MCSGWVGSVSAGKKRGGREGAWMSLLGKVTGSLTVARNRFFQLLSGWDLLCIIWMLLSVSENRQEFFPQAAPIWLWRREGGLRRQLHVVRYVRLEPPSSSCLPAPALQDSIILMSLEEESQKCDRYFPLWILLSIRVSNSSFLCLKHSE